MKPTMNPETDKICPLCEGCGTGEGRNKPFCNACGGYGSILKTTTTYVNDEWEEEPFVLQGVHKLPGWIRRLKRGII